MGKSPTFNDINIDNHHEIISISIYIHLYPSISINIHLYPSISIYIHDIYPSMSLSSIIRKNLHPSTPAAPGWCSSAPAPATSAPPGVSAASFCPCRWGQGGRSLTRGHRRWWSWGVEALYMANMGSWAIEMGVHVDLMIKNLSFCQPKSGIEPVKSGFFVSISKIADLRIKHLFMTSENGHWNHVKHIRLMGCKSLLYVGLSAFRMCFRLSKFNPYVMIQSRSGKQERG